MQRLAKRRLQAPEMRKRVWLSIDPTDARHTRFLELVEGQKYKTEYIVNAVLGYVDGVCQLAHPAPKVEEPEEETEVKSEEIAQEVMDLLDDW